MLILGEATLLAFFACLATNIDNLLLVLSGGSAALLALCAYVLLSRQGATARLLRIAARARPWILIAVGLLILMDTGFDTQ